MALGIEAGILIGVALSIGMLIYSVSYPHIAILGRVPGTNEFRNIERFDNLIVDSTILIFRFDAQLYFANTSAFQNFVLGQIKQNPMIKNIVVDMSSINNLDSSAFTMAKALIEELIQRKIGIYFSNVRGPIRDKLVKNSMLSDENVDHFFLATLDAVEYIQSNKKPDVEPYLIQSFD